MSSTEATLAAHEARLDAHETRFEQSEEATKGHGEKLDRLLYLIIATLTGVVGSLFGLAFKH